MPGAVFLTGENIELRTVEEEDAKTLRDIANHSDVRKFIGVRHPMNLEAEKDFLEDEQEESEVMLSICIEGETIGDIKLTEIEPNVGEIGIMIDPKHHGDGYGTEASELLVKHAFEQLDFHKLYAWVFETNEKSARVWEKLGFEKEAELENHYLIDGEYKKAYIYSLLRREWE